MAQKIGVFVWILAFAGTIAGGCGGSTASYTRARRASADGRMVAASEIRAEDFLAHHALEDAPRPAPGVDLRAPVLLEARSGSASIPSSSSRAAVQVSLRGGVAAARYPSAIVVLVDVSGSMQEGDKIGAVRHALATLCERLDGSDRIAIVTFADHAHVALASTDVAAHRREVLDAVGQLSAYGGTNLYEGLSSALELAGRMHTADATTRVIVLSDGVPSIGVTDPSAFAQLSRDAHDAAISITTVGMGSAIDYDLLDSIARTAGGEFHYLDRPSEVEHLFSSELVALLATAARDVRVRVRIPPGWSLAQSYSERSEVLGDVIETRVGDLPSDGAFVVLHELAAPPGFGAVEVPVEVVLTFADGTSTAVAETRLHIGRDAYAPAMPDDPSVLRNLALGQSALALRTGSGLASAGDLRGAWTVLHQAIENTHASIAALNAMGDGARAHSLREPLEMLDRSLSLLPTPVGPVPSTGSLGWTVSPAAPNTADGFAGWR
jgi:Ca-activated chloride channel family protein